MTDMFDLGRFVEAQDHVYESVIDQLMVGQKRGHWMWYVFPQIQGLGASRMAQRYAISCRDEAEAYSEHPILGLRLRACTTLVMNAGRDIDVMFGHPDSLKFRSSMTLFEHASTGNGIFQDALIKCFGGTRDQRTLDFFEK